VGHDWGGAVGYGVADLYPEMVRAYVCVNAAHMSAFAKSRSSDINQFFKSWYIIFNQVIEKNIKCLFCSVGSPCLNVSVFLTTGTLLSRDVPSLERQWHLRYLGQASQ
jgi:pimeloyl-ACP methyl ester carboxylesterase